MTITRTAPAGTDKPVPPAQPEMAEFRRCRCGHRPAVVILASGRLRVTCEECGFAVQASGLAAARAAWDSLDQSGNVALTPHPAVADADGQ